MLNLGGLMPVRHWDLKQSRFQYNSGVLFMSRKPMHREHNGIHGVQSIKNLTDRFNRRNYYLNSAAA
jgi:hypothetical protein